MQLPDTYIHFTSSARRQKGLTGYCFKYIERPLCLQTDEIILSKNIAADSDDIWDARGPEKNKLDCRDINFNIL